MAHNWHTSDRRSRLPKNWPSIRNTILKRDGYQCVALDDGTRCTQPATDVDHIEPGDNHNERNLQSLCAWHHSRKTAAEAAASRPTPVSRNRPKERHPGAL